MKLTITIDLDHPDLESHPRLLVARRLRSIGNKCQDYGVKSLPGEEWPGVDISVRPLRDEAPEVTHTWRDDYIAGYATKRGV